MLFILRANTQWMPGVVFIFSSTLTACFALKELQDLKIFQEGGVCFLILTISCHKSLCTSCFGTLRSLVRMCYRWHPHDRCFTFCSHWFSGLFRPMFLKVKSQLLWATSKKSSYTSECILGYFPMFIHSKKRNWFVYPPVIDSTMRHGYFRPLSDLSAMIDLMFRNVTV